MSRWLKRDSSLGFATQSDYVTEAPSGYTYLLAGDDVSVDLAREVVQTQLLEGVVGANSAPLAGSKHGGKIKVKVPLRGCSIAYDPTSDAISGKTPPEFQLLAIALGSGAANAAFNAIYKAAADSLITNAGDNITVKYTGTISQVDGAFFCSAASDHAVPPVYSNLVTGWVQAKDTVSSPHEIDLFEGAANVATVGDDVFPTSTIALSTVQPTPITIKYVGSDAAFAYVLVGCVCDSAVLTLSAKAVPTLELGYTFTSHRRDTSMGGMHVPASFTRVQPSIGLKGARLTLGGNVKPGVADLKIDYSAALAYVDSHTAVQGVAECIVTSRTVKVTCSIPLDSSDTITAGSSPYETALENGTTIGGLCLTTGTKPGQILSILVPALRVTAQPKLADKGGFIVEQLEFEAAAYTSDEPNTTAGVQDAAPADSVLRIGLA